MGIKLFVLLSMLFLYIVDDYYLQGWLASAKQKSWWDKNAPEGLYKNDYLMALFMHSFSWTFMIMLPLTLYVIIGGGVWYPLWYLGNVVIHMITDNEKANRHTINLIQDQTVHMIQILVTWTVFVIL